MLPDRLPINPIENKTLNFLQVFLVVPGDHFASVAEIRAELIMQDSDNYIYTTIEIEEVLQGLIGDNKIEYHIQESALSGGYRKIVDTNS
jgi:hypothetical protein